VKTPEKILFVMPRWVGDAVMATPLIEAVHRAWPSAEKHLLIKRYLRGLLRDAPWSDREIVIEPGDSFWSLRRQLARERYDVGFLLPNSLRPALLLRAARVRRRVGYRRNGRAPLLTDGLPFPKERPFRMVDFYGRLGTRLGLEVAGDAPRLYVAEGDRLAAATLLARHGVAPGARLVGVNPGAKYGSSKLWPTEHFATAADDVARRTGASIVLLAGPGEDDLAADIAGRMTGPATALPSAEVDLVMLKAVLGHLDLLISNDTGPRHIAAAVGVPTVTVFGPTHAVWGENEHPTGVDLSIGVDCGPCMQRTCPEGHHRCMTDLAPERVVGVTVNLLAAGD
jgi:heptosyltransferase-2